MPFCLYCQANFEAKNKKQLFCSEICRKYHKKTHRIIECIICKQDFITFRKNQIYCSNSCRNKDKKQSNEFLKIRFDIFKRDNFTCKYCGKNPTQDKIKLHIDHIIPRSKGGLDIESNLITSCQECNLGKSDKLLDLPT